MLTIAICDDDRMYREEAAEYCRRYGEKQRLDYKIKLYGSGEELLEDVPSDILLLDVEMAGVDGLHVKEILQRQKVETAILFISSHQEVIQEAFGRQVYGFLKKPLEYEIFQKKMDIVLEDLAEQNRYIMCETSTGVRKILLNQIQYIQAEGKYTKLYLTGEKEYILSDKRIGSWNQDLGNKGFGMSHRSYLVNFCYVRGMEKEIILKDGQQIPMSRRMEKEFREQYKEFIWRKAR